MPEILQATLGAELGLEPGLIAKGNGMGDAVKSLACVRDTQSKASAADVYAASSQAPQQALLSFITTGLPTPEKCIPFQLTPCVQWQPCSKLRGVPHSKTICARSKAITYVLDITGARLWTKWAETPPGQSRWARACKKIRPSDAPLGD